MTRSSPRYQKAVVAVAVCVAGVLVAAVLPVVHTPAATTAVMSWGLNRSGALGRKTGTFDPAPRAVPKLSGFTRVSAGGKHALALRNDGTVWAWGSNESGQLGDGTDVSRRAPVQVRTKYGALKGIAGISAGGSHSVALTADGRVVAWGENRQGQLGLGDRKRRTLATGVGLSKVKQVSAGGAHTLAVVVVKKRFAALSWGSNAEGQLGRDLDDVPQDRPGKIVQIAFYADPEASKDAPDQVPYRFTSVAAGGAHSLAIEQGEDWVYSWGRNSSGQLGLGFSGDPEYAPTTVGNDYRYSAERIAAGGNHSLAILAKVHGGEFNPTHVQSFDPEGLVIGWGANSQGQLGDGTTTKRDEPVVAHLPFKPTRITAGSSHSQAYNPGGRIYSWGKNDLGAVGDGTTTRRKTPVVVDDVNDTLSADAGSDFSLAIALVDPPATPKPTPVTPKEEKKKPKKTPKPTPKPTPTPRPRVPKLKIDPGIGPPGFVATATGSGFPDNTVLTLRWSKGIGQTRVRTGPNNGFKKGSFTVPVLIYPRDLLGTRYLRPAGYTVRARFLVVPAQLQPRRFAGRG